MKPENPLKHFLLAFLIALTLYLVAFNGIEHLRYRKGPWQATFTAGSDDVPVLVVSQPALNITDLKITFPDEKTTNRSPTITFRQPRPTPYDVPFGRCIFEDLTFLPGTVTFDLFGHEIELLPRVLIVNKKQLAWRSGAMITLFATNRLANRSQPK